MNSKAMDALNELSSDICKSDGVKRVANQVAPRAANVVVTSATGSPEAGNLAERTVRVAAKTMPQKTAEVAVAVALDAAVPVALVAAAGVGAVCVAKKAGNFVGECIDDLLG